MTFQETEYPTLFAEVLALLGREDRPVLAEEMVEEVWKVHKRIPLYPGIVSACLHKMIEEAKTQDLKRGDRVAMLTSAGKFYGTVEAARPDEIILKDAAELRKMNYLRVDPRQVFVVTRLVPDALQKVWPTLVFDTQEK